MVGAPHKRLQCETQRLNRLQISISSCCLLGMLRNEFDMAEIETLWLSRIEIWGARFTSVFSVVAGWIARLFFVLNAV